jgi:hypothetical protein
MNRILHRCQRVWLFAFLLLVAMAIPPIGGVANAAPSPTACQPGEGNSCFLDISAPESVAANEPFTVNVTLFQYGSESDDFPLPKSDYCASRTVVTLLVSPSEGPPDATYTAKAAGGVAKFNIVIPTEGFWNLDAEVIHEEGNPNCGFFDEDSESIMVVDVPPGQPITPCPPDSSCVQATSGGGSTATLYAKSGEFIGVVFEPFAEPGCGDGGPDDPDGVLSFDYVGTDAKTVVYWIGKAFATKKAKQYKFCWQSPNAFTPLGGGDAVNVGYLPRCTRQNGEIVPPCIRTQKNKKGAVKFVILVPPGDPKGYPNAPPDL